MAGAIIAAGLRLVAKVSLVYIWLAFIIVIYVLQSAKVQRFFETTKCLVDFLRNVEIMVLVEVYGQIGQKANWANCFFQCVQGMLRIISIIYIIINIIYILYLLLTWNSRCAYMKMPNLLLPNLPILEDVLNEAWRGGLFLTGQWHCCLWYICREKAELQRSHSGLT